MAFVDADVQSRLDDLLLDASRVRWPLTERRRWFLNAQQTAIDASPGAGFVFDATITLAAGVAQECPATVDSKNVGRITGFLYNVTPAGAVGPAVRLIGKDQLDTQRPSWPTKAATGTIKYVMPLVDEPRRFLVYPQAGSATTECKLRVSLSQMPTLADGTVYVRDAYMMATVFWTAGMCHLKDDTPSTKAPEFLNSWLNEMKVKPGADLAVLKRIYERALNR